MLSRTCTKCGMEKLLSEFYKSGNPTKRQTRSWYRGDCRDCYNRAVSQKYHADPQVYLERQRKSRFGISGPEYKEMLARQGGGCAICGTKPKSRGLHIDHNHITGVVRGLLCSNCNTAIGKLGDTAEGVMRAVRYLSKA